MEPIEWRSATTEPIPTGGGLVPLSLGISKKDPWGTEYGYCVWNHGPSTSANGCGTNMLAGTNSKIYPVVSLISAGPDKAFTTTCRSFATADVNGDFDLLDATDLQLVSKASESDDDIITSFTYDEATGASGGLWSIKSGFPDTAVISKNIETTGTATLGGGLLLPDKSFVTCDLSTAGVMAMNGSAIEICNGTTWDAITGGSVIGGGLILTPNVSTGMNVTGGCGAATCYSTNQTFTLTNNLSPAGPSDTLVTTLSNTANFEFVSNNCAGQILAAGANCMMVVRAKASGNVAYAGQLTITGNNSPFATLDGTAGGFSGCNIGGNAPGGVYTACGVGGYNLITTPGGCTNTTSNPTCAGGVDTVGQMGMGGFLNDSGIQTNTGDGLQNTLTLMAYSGGAISFPAASWCGALDYGGYDDWFLPSLTELSSYLYVNRVAVGGWIASGGYMSSTTFQGANNLSLALTPTNTNINVYSATTTLYTVRCMRWDPVKTTVAVVDNSPSAVSFSPSYGGAAETRTSSAVTIYGVTEPVIISISGGIDAKFSKNGGIYTAITRTVTNGDQIALRATSPAAGQESVVTITIGGSSFNWLVRTPGNNTIRVFTTSTTNTGNFGGAGGADSFCTARASAVGLAGSWAAVVGTGTGLSLNSRLPWNWTALKNMNNQTVAVSLADFVDGSISAPMNYSESSGIVASNIWTGLNTDASTAGNCANWTIASSSGNSFGDSAATTGGAYFAVNAGNCGGSLRLLCMETNAAGVDTDPNAVSIRPQVTFVSGGTGTSNTVTITGVTDEVPVSITPSAGTADIIKDGIAVGATTTTAGLNATLTFTLTAPATFGTKNTATITIGPDTYTWWVGYADNSRVAKAFVGSLVSAGNTGGLSGADSRCNAIAASSSLGLSGSWKAMLSDSTTDMGDRIPWNWGSLQNTIGGSIADGGFPDLLDGSLDGPINWDQNGNPVNATAVATGFNANGIKAYGTASSAYACNWTDGYNSCGSGPYGHSSSAGSNWASQGVTGSAYVYHLYCIENVDNITDTTPSSFGLAYAIQVPTSSRQASASRTVSGMSSGVTQTLSVSATGGDPKFTVNGGAEVSSASVRNGDVVVFYMDAPATGNSSYRMTITAGSMTGYWRVWTGDPTGSITKRVFVTSSTYNGNSGGLGGADAKCTAAASGAGLSGSWKAIISGTLENEYAINRIGYNWSALYLVDGTTLVTTAGGLWNTGTTPLSNPISKTQSGANLFGVEVSSNTTRFGSAYDTNSFSMSSCNVWSVTGNSGMHRGYNSNMTY